MDTVRVSPKFQVVIPKKVREVWKLKPGEELHIYILDRTIRLSRPAPSRNFAASPRACSGRMTIVTATTASKFVVVDSSGWLEYLTEDTKADLFAPYLKSPESLLLPTIACL